MSIVIKTEAGIIMRTWWLLVLPYILLNRFGSFHNKNVKLKKGNIHLEGNLHLYLTKQFGYFCERGNMVFIRNPPCYGV